MNVRCLTVPEFAGMRVAWTRLLDASGCISPMLTWEWCFRWWEAYQTDGIVRSLFVLVAERNDGTLIGILPMVQRRVAVRGLPARRLEFVGTGERELDETCSELLDAIVYPECMPAVAEAFARYLAADQAWDEIVWRDVRRDVPAAVAKIQEELGQLDARCTVRAEASGACPWIPLPANWEAYLRQVSSSRATRIRYERRRLSRDFEVSFRRLSNPEVVQEGMQTLRRLHQDAWRQRGRPGCFASQVFDVFLSGVGVDLAAFGQAELAELALNGQPVASFLLFVRGNRLFYYNSGIAAQAYPKYSIGNVMLGYILEDAMNRGIREFHFFKGAPGSYKEHWTWQGLSVATLTVRRRWWHRFLMIGKNP